MTQTQKGLLITFVGAMVLTFDTPVLRLADGPQWTVLFWRMVLLVLAFGAWLLVMRAFGKKTPPVINGRPGMAVAVLYAIGNVTFIMSLYNTTVANVVFILALTPLIAAVMSTVWLKEHLPAITWAALLIALCGVGVIVWNDLAGGSLLGNTLAAVTATTLASALTIVRRTGLNMALSGMPAGVFTASVAFFMAADLTLTGDQWLWLGLNGLVIMPISYALLTIGPRYISSAEVAFFLLLETVLAPVWVWFAVGEAVPRPVLLGGTIILAAILWHSIVRLRRARLERKTD